ncbi:MAG: ribosome small subunit-dependent GTPase A [Methylococcales bacterium]|nr:ribosome small subunit-dependent GTPase A [Methylococcales bacterium]
MTDLLPGVVVAHLGQAIAVAANGVTVICQPRRKLDTLAVGDEVLWQQTAPGQGRIEQVQPRRSLLTRPARNGRIRPVAANLDRVWVVLAAEPKPDWLLVDQFLAVCENRAIDAGLLINKIDLTDTLAELADYQALGYPVLKLSALTGQGLEQLKPYLHERTSLLTGQSGVGKSSLTNALIPDKQLKTQSLSEAAKLGRHTTTTATLYPLPEGGALIDSPGVAIFGLANLTETELAHGFKEFWPLIEQCRFHNCRHVKDADCAVREKAATDPAIARRYRRFLKLREKMPLTEN